MNPTSAAAVTSWRHTSVLSRPHPCAILALNQGYQLWFLHVFFFVFLLLFFFCCCCCFLLLFFFCFFFLEFKLTIIYLAIDNKRAMIIDYGTPKLTYVVIFLVVLSKNCVNLSMHYVIVLKTRVVLSIYNVDMPTHCLIMLKNYFILSQRGVILSKKHVNLSI